MDSHHNNIRKIILLVGLLVGIMAALNAQPVQEKDLRPFQVTFLYPLGTNGLESANFRNSFSLNILGGISGGTKGFEAGGIFNTDLGDVKGTQFAGMVNLVHGNFDGGQFGGMVNLNTGKSKGAFFAGFTNLSLDEMQGAQFAGIANLGIKRSGSAQIAGLGNFSAGPSQGIQLAGLTNISLREHKGAQIAGILNYTTKLNGFQMALINVADTIEKGTPLGFISLVRHGYFHAEVEFNELFPMNFTVKTGVNHLYNIFSIGYRPKNGKSYWGLTYGLGTWFPMNEKLSMNLDLTATHINEGESWTDVLNMVNRLKWNLGYRLGESLELYGGISFNVALSKLKDSEGRITGSAIVPEYTFYDETIRATHVKIYPGFNIGIRI